MPRFAQHDGVVRYAQKKSSVMLPSSVMLSSSVIRSSFVILSEAKNLVSRLHGQHGHDAGGRGTKERQRACLPLTPALSRKGRGRKTGEGGLSRRVSRGLLTHAGHNGQNVLGNVSVGA